MPNSERGYSVSGLDLMANGIDHVLSTKLPYKDIETLLDRSRGRVAILYQTGEHNGHWVALRRSPVDPDAVDFMDSYGLAPDEEFAASPAVIGFPVLADQLAKKGLKVNSLPFQLQEFKENENECGRYVIDFLNSGAPTLEAWIKSTGLTEDQKRNDEIIRARTSNIVAAGQPL